MDDYKIDVREGCPYPLGAAWDGKGVNFAIYSEHATKVYLCLFDNDKAESETRRIQLKHKTHHIWHVYVPGVSPGQAYAYRMDGPYEPEAGHKFNANKLLIDPYAKAITGTDEISAPMHGFPFRSYSSGNILDFDDTDSAYIAPKCIVVDDAFDWEGIEKPKIPFNSTIIYETHLKGFTAIYNKISEQDRGTYKAMTHDAVLEYFKDMGVTSVEFLPVHQFVHNTFLLKHGLRNYWGYNTLGFFAPHAGYSSSVTNGDQVREFKEMVKTFHKNGLEVILDVVYNHTGEGDHFGPTLSFRGIDNANYYRVNPKHKEKYIDYTGTGNTLNIQNPFCLQLVMDSLRYWATEMQVDGFRFDLASTLARGSVDVLSEAPFLHAVHQDPILSKCKLIAEPWDLGPGGYQVGRFPFPWSEWNGKYRDNVRRFWRGDEHQVVELAHRLTGSSDLYKLAGKNPTASINFITSHDGFTLNDLVSYNKKHNRANKENNRDGDDHNHSFNYGAEGETNDKTILSIRERQKRNLLSTLLLSHGVPMLSHGDEYGRSQHGNNNAYCQDTELAWMHWDRDEREKRFFDFVKKIIQLRKKYKVFCPKDYPPLSFQQEKESEESIHWIKPDGSPMQEHDWHNGGTRCIGVLYHGNMFPDGGELTDSEENGNFLLLMNSYWETIDFHFPERAHSGSWEILVDTSLPQAENLDSVTGLYSVEARSLVLFKEEAVQRKI